MDDSIIHLPTLEQFLKFLPPPEELKVISNYSGDMELIGPVDMLYHRLSQLSGIELRLKSWIYVMNFQEDFHSKQDDLVTLETCFEILQNDERLPKFLNMFLTFGNFINQGHRNGDAKGFRLRETLPKFALLKTFSTKPEEPRTMLEFIVQYLREKDPEMLAFAEHKEVFEAAHRVEQALFLNGVHHFFNDIGYIDRFLKIPSSHADRDKAHEVLKVCIGMIFSSLIFTRTSMIWLLLWQRTLRIGQKHVKTS